MQELESLKSVVQKSRFFAHLYSIENEEEIKSIIKLHRKTYKKANHHCWAARSMISGKLVERSRNDGEVGQPGIVMLELLRKYNLTANALMISRIFGGIKLGTGGVSRAFREVGAEVIKEWIRHRQLPP